jgi:uncharacterized protein YndB with AHSA1/START domain
MLDEIFNHDSKKVGEITLTRLFDASPDLVWKNWTEPHHVKTWWGPKGFICTFADIDLHVGGVALYCMRSPEGRDYWSTGIFREILKLSRIICTDSFADERGNVVPASFYGMNSDQPLEMLWTVTFENIKGKTKFTLNHSGLLKGTMSDQTYLGWCQTLDKFSDSLKYALPGNSTANINQQLNHS